MGLFSAPVLIVGMVIFQMLETLSRMVTNGLRASKYGTQQTTCVRCMPLERLTDVAKIGSSIASDEIVIFSIKNISTYHPIEAKRALQQIRALSLEHNCSLSMLGRDFVMVLPATHELVLPTSS
jgi:SepF-like predicted cell division protein (DUF552 family)